MYSQQMELVVGKSKKHLKNILKIYLANSISEKEKKMGYIWTSVTVFPGKI
jgi:hypothetical protein